MRKWVVIAVAAGTALFLAGSAVGALANKLAFAWMSGDEQSYIGRPEGTSDLELFARTDLNALANHIRLGGRDGNFEFEHAASRPYSHLNAYFIGTNTRTPILIGGDEQDVTSLIVTGESDQKNDLQQWTPGGKVKIAIDGQGRLRLGTVRIVTRWCAARPCSPRSSRTVRDKRSRQGAKLGSLLRTALTAAAVVVAAAAVAAAAGGGTIGRNPIADENALKGTTTWNTVQAAFRSIEGYTSEVSAAPGDTIHFHVQTEPVARYRIDLYRLGWYGGMGARLITCLPACATRTSRASPSRSRRSTRTPASSAPAGRSPTPCRSAPTGSAATTP